MTNNNIKQFLPTCLSLFTSLSTLVCCALPALLVSIGMGATLVSIVSALPWMVVLSKYKIQLFLVSGLLLVISGYLFWRGRNAPCPIDPNQANICAKLRFYNFIIIIISLLIYLIGFFFAFLIKNFY